MTVVNVHEAKTKLSKLLAEVEAGGEVVIARNGKPVARLTPVDGPKPKRRPGALKGKLVVPESFFEPMTEEELAEWE